MKPITYNTLSINEKINAKSWMIHSLNIPNTTYRMKWIGCPTYTFVKFKKHMTQHPLFDSLTPLPKKYIDDFDLNCFIDFRPLH